MGFTPPVRETNRVAVENVLIGGKPAFTWLEHELDELISALRLGDDPWQELFDAGALAGYLLRELDCTFSALADFVVREEPRVARKLVIALHKLDVFTFGKSWNYSTQDVATWFYRQAGRLRDPLVIELADGLKWLRGFTAPESYAFLANVHHQGPHLFHRRLMQATDLLLRTEPLPPPQGTDEEYGTFDGFDSEDDGSEMD